MICTHRRSALLLLLVLCASFVSPAHAGEQARSTVSIAGFESLILLKGGASADDAVPMIIGLHYSSGSPEAIEIVFDAIDFPARVILPRGNHPRAEGSSWFAESYAKLPAAEQAKVSLEAMKEMSAFVAEAVKRHPTVGKPAITGISYGGDLSYLLAIHRPGEISAAFPVAARFPAEWLPESDGCGTSCPTIVVMHGAADPIVPVQGARDAARRLNERNYRVELREYADVGHDFTKAMRSDFTKKVREVLDGASPLVDRHHARE